MTSIWVDIIHNITGIVHKCISPTCDKSHDGSTFLGYGFAFFSGMTVGIVLTKLNDYHNKKQSEQKEEEQPQQKEEQQQSQQKEDKRQPQQKEEQQPQQKEEDQQLELQQQQGETSSIVKYGLVGGLCFAVGAFAHSLWNSEPKPTTHITINTAEVDKPGASFQDADSAIQSTEKPNDHSTSSANNHKEEVLEKRALGENIQNDKEMES